MLTHDRIKDLAQNWPALKEWRLETIQNLAALARVADDRDARLLLRAELSIESSN